jgi:hypothetical protein
MDENDVKTALAQESEACIQIVRDCVGDPNYCTEAERKLASKIIAAINKRKEEPK